MRDRQTMRDIAPKTFQDKALQCVDCGDSFVWTAGEQTYYNDKGLAPVKRCSKCRAYRRQTIHPSADFDTAINRARALFSDDDDKGVRQ